MQTANVMLELGGDSGTTVPKYGITASEIAVLRAIHGPSSVTDIEPTDDVERTDRAEVARLHEIYGRAKRPGVSGSDEAVVASLFPGAAARAYQTLNELDIPDEFYKAESRVKPKSVAKAEKPAKGAKGKKADHDDAESPEDIEAKLAAEDKLFD